MTSTFDQTEMQPELKALHHQVQQLREQLNQVLRGKQSVIELVLISLLAKGHLLLEDQPGTGKTTLAKALATGLGEVFARVQCTPDLLPSDMTGFNIFNQKSQEFEFRKGPVFAEILLVDEINRATPRTQSALLEAMAERQVSIDAEHYPLSGRFFVIATQNPIEQHGTYPLPEAQLDRFAMKLSIGYPEFEDEVQMLQQAIEGHDDSSRLITDAILKPGELDQLQQQVSQIFVATNIHHYLVQVAHQTRHHPRIHLGLSPRGLLIWQRCAQACAFLHGRHFVTPEDVLELAKPVLSVRLGMDDLNPDSLIEELMNSVEIPLKPVV